MNTSNRWPGDVADPQDARHDLDANTPLLRSHDAQRINRKALVFLGGIVGLLLTAAAWMFHGAAAGNDTGARRRQETVVIPALPPAMPSARVAEPTATAPIALAAATMGPELPPLPPAQAQPLPPLPSALAVAQPPRRPSLAERRMGAPDAAAASGPSLDPYTQALIAGMPVPAATAPTADLGVASPQPSQADASSARFLAHADVLLVRGTYIRCVLETRIVTDIAGFTACVITQPVYSVNGRTLLLPKGSKLSGRYDTNGNGPRVAVVWDRILTPDNIDIRMASPGVDNLGGAGHPGDADAHWPSRIGAALMISLISDVFKYEGEKNGPVTTTVSNGLVTQAPFDSNTARTMERLANQALDRSISRPTTVTINQGSVVNVYVARDVDFSGVAVRR